MALICSALIVGILNMSASKRFAYRQGAPRSNCHLMDNYGIFASIMVLQRLLPTFLLSTCKTTMRLITALLKSLTTQPLKLAFDSMLVIVFCWITPVYCKLARHFLTLAPVGCNSVMPIWMAYFLTYLCLTTTIKMYFWVKN